MPYYAVQNGRIPGVYKSWAACQQQVKQFPKACFQKFNTEEEACEFFNKGSGNTNKVKSELPDITVSSPNVQPKSSSSTKYKGTSPEQSKALASIEMLRTTVMVLRQQLLSGLDMLTTQIDQVAASVHSGNYGSALGQGTSPEQLKRSFSDFTPLGLGGSGDDSKPSKKKAKKSNPVESTDCGFTGTPFPEDVGTVVYTDGASFNNGRASAKAGIGVFWGHGDPKKL